MTGIIENNRSSGAGGEYLPGTIRDALFRVLETIRSAEARCGRPEGSVRLMAVSKFHSVEEIAAA
ncbi:MAG: hypothetical protein LBR47_03525, partial [Spirochaetaceae bacterium]|nr:hypothetical protein [Spirochaetaceae bacterium]